MSIRDSSHLRVRPIKAGRRIEQSGQRVFAGHIPLSGDEILRENRTPRELLEINRRIKIYARNVAESKYIRFIQRPAV